MGRTRKKSLEEWLQQSIDDYGLPKVICKRTFLVQKENMYPNKKRSLVKQADDEVLIVGQSGINYIELAIWSACFSSMLIMLIINWENEIPVVRYIWAFVDLLFLFLILRCFRDVHKKFTFNRLTGKVTYPATRWFKTTTEDFDDLFLKYHKEAFHSAVPAGLAIKRDKLSFITIVYDYPISMLALLVWYMDCNRPLPQGSAFDQYREKDYLRRKGEGFPAPLYSSAIETPEWEGAETNDHSIAYAPDAMPVEPKEELNMPVILE